VAQRLVRRLCPDCKVPVTHRADDLLAAGFQVAGDVQAFAAQGCKRCGKSGHKGRLGLFEILQLDDDVRSLILREAPAHELRAQAALAGMTSMKQDGLLKVMAGEVALTEVVRVLG
jgi:type II secretory ATPase GspE/PulE/Tfp pilus assembly ATPase PilB-like protein